MFYLESVKIRLKRPLFTRSREQNLAIELQVLRIGHQFVKNYFVSLIIIVSVFNIL